MQYVRISYKFNDQYGRLTPHQTNSVHDRFLILDDEKIYLIGASLKDAGKRLFAFTEMSPERIEELKKALWEIRRTPTAEIQKDQVNWQNFQYWQSKNIV